MKINTPDKVMAWLGPIILANIFIWFVVLSPAPNAALCNGTSNCLIEWVGALSGWAALLVAFATLTTIQRQIQLQQKQIDFQLGDADPICYATSELSHEFEPLVILTVKNWNRRPLVLSRVAWARTFDVKIKKIAIDGEEIRFLSHLNGSLSGTIPGRSDDGSSSVAEIHLTAYRSEGFSALVEDGLKEWDNYAIRLRLICRQIDNISKTVELDAETAVFTI